MITKQELNPKGFKTTEEQQANLDILLERINVIRKEWNKPMTITSGFRSTEDHLRIYKEIATRNKKEFDATKVPMKSKHLAGAACDVLDSDGSLMKWCRENVELLEKTGLWIEDDTSVPRVHFQIFAPKSGNRFFKP